MALKSRVRGIQSIEVGGRILAALAKTGHQMKLRDLAAAAELTPAQAHAYLSSYRKTGMVEQDPATGSYRLGPFALKLALARIRSYEPFRGSLEIARELSHALGHFTAIVVLANGLPTVISVHDGQRDMSLNIREGTVFQFTTTVTGRVFAAHSRLPEVRATIAAELEAGGRRENLKSDFLATMRQTKRSGFAQGVGIATPDIATIAAPVLDPDGEPYFVVTLIDEQVELFHANNTKQTLLDVTRRWSDVWNQNPSSAEKQTKRSLKAVAT